MPTNYFGKTIPGADNCYTHTHTHTHTYICTSLGGKEKTTIRNKRIMKKGRGKFNKLNELGCLTHSN